MKIFYWVDVAVFLAFAGLMVFSCSWSPRYLFGIAVSTVSFVLWMVARHELGKSFTFSPQARALVTTGIYSKIRHPIYVFGELAYIGLFIAWGNKFGILYIVVVTPVLLFRAQREDALLEKSFGEEYRRYKAKTWF